MKTYEIVRNRGGEVGCTVTIGTPNGGERRTTLLRHCVYHSPAGFNVGYGGSGPADLALSILADFLGVTPEKVKRTLDTALTLSYHNASHIPIKMHQMFKADFIARIQLEPGDSFKIPGDEIARWIEKNKQ
jgi:hypothetical protein